MPSEPSPIVMDRRSHINTIFSSFFAISTNTFAIPQKSFASNQMPPQTIINELTTPLDYRGTVTLPLEQCSGGGLCVRLIIKGISLSHSEIEPLKVVRAIVDTGSPYLVLPAEDDDTEEEIIENPFLRWFSVLWNSQTAEDLFQPLQLQESEYAPTKEIYGSKAGSIQWKKASIQFRDPQLITKISSSNNNDHNEELVLGVMDSILTKESGGTLLGLVKRSNEESTKVQLRPTFINQERIESIPRKNNPHSFPKYEEISSFVLNAPNRTLSFSSKSQLPPISSQSPSMIFPLVDLRPLGDFVEHYACLVDQLYLNSTPLSSSILPSKRKIVAVFDSGLTGCLLTQPFWEELQQMSKSNPRINDPESIDSIKVQIKTQPPASKYMKPSSILQPNHVFMESSSVTNRLFYVAPISLDWFDDDSTAPHVIVLGQTFLQQGVLTIDIDDRLGSFETMKT